jgi:hypothetical protein
LGGSSLNVQVARRGLVREVKRLVGQVPDPALFCSECVDA